MKIALIVNPCSGGKKAKRYLPRVIRKLSDHNVQSDIFISRHRNHIFTLCAGLNISQYAAIIVMGGDGSNFHLINGLLASNPPQALPPLGILPAGSGNSFAKDLGIQNLGQGIQAIVNYSSRQVDVCSYTNKGERVYFINLAGLGFVTDVAMTAEKFKRLNDVSYLIGVIYRTLHLNFHHMDLEIDGTRYSKKNCFVEFCNSRYTGGNMLMAPNAKIDDGLMDIVILAPMSKQRLLSALPNIYKGTHIHMPEITCIRAKNAVIKTRPLKTLLPDGEIMGSTPATIEVHHKQLRYLG